MSFLRNEEKQENDIKEAYRLLKILSDKGYENAMFSYADLIQSSDKEEAFRLYKILIYKDCFESRFAAEPYIRLLYEKNTQESKNEAIQLAVKFWRPLLFIV